MSRPGFSQRSGMSRMAWGSFIRSVRIRWDLVRADDYLRGIPALAALGEEPLALASNVTFFVGENGSGKSTLLEAMAVAQSRQAVVCNTIYIEN